jgi:hypothetical protein
MAQQRWNEADARRFADRDMLRARSVPGRRFDGPDETEWDIDDIGDLEPVEV